jgi:hypothetical protein
MHAGAVHTGATGGQQTGFGLQQREMGQAYLLGLHALILGRQLQQFLKRGRQPQDRPQLRPLKRRGLQLCILHRHLDPHPSGRGAEQQVVPPFAKTTEPPLPPFAKL